MIACLDVEDDITCLYEMNTLSLVKPVKHKQDVS